MPSLCEFEELKYQEYDGGKTSRNISKVRV